MAIVYNKQLTEGFKYIPEDQRDDKKPFSVTIKPIDSVRLVTLEDGLLKRGQDNTLSISTGSYNVSLCKNALIGWDNMIDEKGKVLDIDLEATGYISNDSLSNLPTNLITEIAGVIAASSQDPANIQLFISEDK